MDGDTNQKVVIAQEGVQPGTRVDYALRYASAGFKVFPLHHIVGGSCSCGDTECRSPGKHPLVIPEFSMFGGVHSATNDRSTLVEIFSKNPQANIGIAIPEDMIAIDVDPRNGGDVTIDNLQEQYGKLPDTAMQLTGGGGFHYLYRKDPSIKVAGKLGVGIDIKAAGGYIVGEPSNHESGNSYVWEASSDPLEGVAILPAPQWVMNKLAAGEASTGRMANGLVYGVDEKVVRELRSALTYLNVNKPELTDDRDMWVRVGMACKSIGDAGYEIWENWSIASKKYDPDDQWKKWQSFAPNSISYRTVFAMAQLEGWRNPMSKSESVVSEQQNTQEGSRSGFIFEDVSELIGDIQPIDWLIHDYVEQNCFVQIYGPPGSAKSFCAIDFACCVATGTDWMGNRVKQGPVFYIAGEGHNGLKRRFTAWSIDRGIDIDPCMLWKSLGAVQMLDDKSAEDMGLAIFEKVTQGGEVPAMIIIDTLARNFGPGDENKTEDMTKFIAAVDKYLIKAWGCTVVLVHHSGHDMDRARGSSALKAAVDAEFKIEKDDHGKITVKATKMKDAEPPPELFLKLKSVGLGVFFEGEEVTSAVLEADQGESGLSQVVKKANGKEIRAFDVINILRRGWLTKKHLAEALDCSETTAYDAMKKCVDLGYLWHEGRGGGLTPKAEELYSQTGRGLTSNITAPSRPWEEKNDD